jgi:methionyl-tRNA synthetase
MDRFDVRGAGDAAWALVAEANQYIVQTAPWTLAKEGRDAELDDALTALARCLFRLAVLASPFMPERSLVLWQALGRNGSPGEIDWSALAEPGVAGDRTHRPPVLFPKPEASPP